MNQVDIYNRIFELMEMPEDIEMVEKIKDLEITYISPLQLLKELRD